MYSVSNTFHTLALSDDRTPYIKLVVGATTYQRPQIVDFTFEEQTAENNITMGQACSSCIQFTLYNNTVLNGATVFAYGSYDNSEWCPLGTFTVTDVEEKGDRTKVTAYDKMAFMTDALPTISTQTIAGVVSAIASKYGLLVQGTVPSTALSEIYEFDCRNTLGYMAGLMGKNAIINRDGKIEFRWYQNNGKTLPKAIKDTIKEQDSYTVQKLISGTSETPIEIGSGYSINFENPYMTQAILTSIYSQVCPFTFTPIEMKYRGNFAYEVGDMFTGGYPIMSQKFDFSQGMTCDLKSYGLSNEKSLISKTITIREVERKLTILEEEVQEMSDDILAGRNGYVVDVIDETGGVKTRRAIRAMNTPEVTPTTKGLEINANGIGWSEDGFTTFVKTILDMANGKLYADQIVANSVLSNTFYIGLTESGYAIKFDGITGNLVIRGNIYRAGADPTDDDFLIGINDTPNLQIGSALEDDQSVYNHMNLYSNNEIRFMVNGAKTSANAKVIINANGALELKTVPSETTDTNAILCIDSSGNVCNSGKTIADIGSGGGGGQAWIAQSSAPSDTTKIWIDTSTGYKIPKIYYGGSWVALNATFG